MGPPGSLERAPLELACSPLVVVGRRPPKHTHPVLSHPTWGHMATPDTPENPTRVWIVSLNMRHTLLSLLCSLSSHLQPSQENKILLSLRGSPFGDSSFRLGGRCGQRPKRGRLAPVHVILCGCAL